ncbi:MAG TPA: acylneuraminate cytidylyltransferase family protein, partial [Candidatus Limnocylindria bacterium]|nr:acylneuraminate cytidylyltransferase family protein [Candidatus Limnocylindria bacterium]
MSTVAIIPARGGSKGLPRKNLRLLGGEPLVVHTVRAALAARRVDRVLVSTDDAAIARAARRAGADVPFRRPPELATDHAATLPVVQHAVAWLEDHGQRVDVVVTLQPTSPLRGPAEIDAVVALLDGGDSRSAVSVALLGVPAAAVG